MLSLVATPIGNLEDITLRAIRTLKEADFIVAEDTRHSGILLKKYDISRPVISFHSHSPDAQLQKIIGLLKEGKNIALISDAGTPGVSDPGYLLIKNAVAEKIPVTAIPGPSAVVTAVTMSGLPCHRFTYLGFLPIKKGRKRMIAGFAQAEHTIVLYEAPHRLLKTLVEIGTATGGSRQIAICREMTKIFEEVFRGTVAEAISFFEKKHPRGEFTIVLASSSYGTI